SQHPHAMVRPLVKTEQISPIGDAANAPAIWIHPDKPALSLILGADKKAGLGVYDLSGKVLQFLPDGRFNNIDVRAGFADIDGLEHIVVVNDRSTDTIE